MPELAARLAKRRKGETLSNHLRKAAGLAPAAPEIQYHLGAALAKSGDKPGARQQLEKLLAANKDFPQRAEAQALLTRL